MAAPAGIALRHLTPEDYPAAVALLALDEEAATGHSSRIQVEDLVAWLSRVDLAADTWVFEEDGAIVAFGWHQPPLTALSFVVGVVHPEARGRGLGSELVELLESRARAVGSERLHYGALAGDPGVAELLTSHGYREVRRFYEMAIELEGAPPSPILAGGLAIETFADADARAFHHAMDDAFQDHWEMESMAFDEWWAMRTSEPAYDPTLWFLVRDGDEVAAVVRNEANRNGGGYVAAIGVRRPWRGRGLGRALLLHTFGEFHRRGVNRITLGVDTESPTGATKLYDSVGMVPEQEQVVYEKALA